MLLYAGEEPVLVLRRFCAALAVPELGCKQLLDHFCVKSASGTAIVLCRSVRSVLDDPVVVADVRADWRQNSQSCAMRVALLRADAERAKREAAWAAKTAALLVRREPLATFSAALGPQAAAVAVAAEEEAALAVSGAAETTVSFWSFGQGAAMLPTVRKPCIVSPEKACGIR